MKRRPWMGARAAPWAVLAMTCGWLAAENLVLRVDPPSAGRATGAGNHATGADAAIAAVANAGFTFAGWTGDGVADPGAATTTVAMTADRVLTAHFTGGFAGEVEYFFDEDPGEGLGTAVAAAEGSASFTADTAGLGEGTHTLYLRARETGGSWGPAMPVPFTQEALGPDEEAAAIESFIDEMPPGGDGDAVTPTSGVIGQDAEVSANVSLTGETPGTRIVYLRAAGPAGVWGLPTPVTVALEASSPRESVAGWEYSLDVPAAPGAGTALPVVSGMGTSATLDAAISTAAWPLGTRVLYLRARDSGGSWGPAFPYTLAMVPDSFTGHAPAPAKLVSYLSQAGAVVAGTRTEEPLAGGSPGGPRSWTIPLAGVPAGATEVVAYLVTDTGESGPPASASFTVVVQGTNGYAAWRAGSGYFTPEEQLDDAISGLDADPDGDGVTNAMEFACGSHPRVASAGLCPSLAMDAGVMRFSFRQRAGGGGHRAYNYVADGVMYTVEWSRDLTSGWHAGGDEFFDVESVTANGDGSETVVVAVDASVTTGQPATFLRLRVTLL